MCGKRVGIDQSAGRDPFGKSATVFILSDEMDIMDLFRSLESRDGDWRTLQLVTEDWEALAVSIEPDLLNDYLLRRP
jgi:hypothetical protein